MNEFYRIYRIDKNKNHEVLAGGVDKAAAEEALKYAGYDPQKVNWNYSYHLSDPRSGNVYIHEGEYIE